MQCTSPKTAFVVAGTGEYIFFDDSRREIEREVVVRCGQCLSCRVSHAATWATRGMHELRRHEASAFLTLTYREPPTTYEAWLGDNQLFLKRLRNEFGAGIKYLGCLERGDQNGQPHSHLAVFGPRGVDFERDRKVCGRSGDDELYRSATLERLWPHGISSIGAVTPESLNYIARYTLKKLTGAQAKGAVIDGVRHFVDWHTGELTRLPFARLLCSRRPGIGRYFVEEFSGDLRYGLRNNKGARIGTPRSYLRWLRKSDPDFYAELLEERRQEFKRDLSEEAPQRCEARDTVLRARLGNKLARSL